MGVEGRNKKSSPLYTLIISVICKILELFGFDSRGLIILAPRLFQAVLSSIGDVFILKFARMTCGPDVARWTLFTVGSSWFLFYSASRTIVNCVETMLTNVALFYFPWDAILAKTEDHEKIGRSYTKSLMTVALGVILRPTAVIFWFPLYFLLMLKLQKNITFWLISVIIGISTIVVCVGIDSLFYGRWTFTPYNFVRFNLLTDQSRIYGTHPWHWYVTQGLPILLGAHLVPFLCQIKRTKLWKLLPVIVWNIIVFSFVPHKEFRFIMPILPTCLVIVAEYFAYSFKTERSKWKGYAKVTALLVVSVTHAIYFSVVHQRGPLDVMGNLANIPGNGKILFLLPCHSTPLYSHLHRNVSARFLTCEPNLRGAENYVDEADVFYRDPVGWLEKEFVEVSQLPTHIVMFENLAEETKRFLNDRRFELNVTFFHTHFPDGRVGRNIQIYTIKDGQLIDPSDIR